MKGLLKNKIKTSVNSCYQFIVDKINSGIDSIKKIIIDKRTREVTIVKFEFTFILTQIVKLSLNFLSPLNLLKFIPAIDTFGIIILLLALDIAPADNNNPERDLTYNVMSLLWMIPISVLFTIICKFMSNLIITCCICIIKFCIDQFLKSKVKKCNENYLKSIA